MVATMPTTGADQLQLTALGDREIFMTRCFDAPRELVFEAWTTPVLVKQWLLGPPGWSMPVCESNYASGAATVSSGGATTMAAKWQWAAATARLPRPSVL